jgi:hypothetical protein
MQTKKRDQQSCKICNKKREREQERLQILQKQKREQNNLQQKKIENLVEEGGRR